MIKEGIILHQGIRYTANISELGNWDTNLIIYLDTEHLFSSVGYNGIVHKELFDDFYKLVLQINQYNSNRKSDNRIILRYFEETKNEIDLFFDKAEKIFRIGDYVDPRRPAMKEILRGCKSLSDIKNKKIRFELDLKGMSITCKPPSQSPYTYHDYIIENQELITQLKKESAQKNRPFDEKECELYFKIFTSINYFRGGVSKTNFENIGCIFITANSFALYLAHQNRVKNDDTDIPFAKNLDFITYKFWFKLKKGLSENQQLPNSFSYVTKAQIVVSSHINQSLSHEYDNLQNQFKNGAITKNELLERSFQLREKTLNPEDITINNIDDSLNFLNTEKYFEELYNEKYKNEKLLSDSQKQIELLSKEIEQRREKDNQLVIEEQQKNYNENKRIFIDDSWKNELKIQWKNFLIFLSISILNLLVIIIALIFKFTKNEDLLQIKTNLGNFSYVIVALLILLPYFDLIGRGFLFNKDKAKLGFVWLTYSVMRKKYSNMKTNKLNSYDEIFEADNSL